MLEVILSKSVALHQRKVLIGMSVSGARIHEEVPISGKIEPGTFYEPEKLIGKFLPAESRVTVLVRA